MAFYCNYNIPIFPSFGALTLSAAGCSVPLCNNFASYYTPPLLSMGMNPFMSMPIWNNCSQPLFDFSNINSNTTKDYTNMSTTTSWYNPCSWFNNWSFNLPSFDFSQTSLLSNSSYNFSGISKSNSTYSGDTFTRTSTISTSSFSNNAVKNLSWWKEQGYNEEKGKQLAANTKKRSDALKAAGIKSQCGRGVREGVNDTFYNGKEHHVGQDLAAKVFGDRYFANDKNLKKINVRGMNLSKEDIPAGAIIIYENYSSNPAGHIEVSGGNGHGYSDFTSTLLQNHGIRKEPKEIWIPV